jgi:hypothetical protein
MLGQDHELRQRREETRIGAREFDDSRLFVRRLNGCDRVEACGENRSGFTILCEINRELHVLGGERLAVVPGFAGELEGILGLVGVDGIFSGESPFDRRQISIVVDQRLEVDVEPGEPACCCKWIEVALETAWPDVKATRDRLLLLGCP